MKKVMEANEIQEIFEEMRDSHRRVGFAHRCDGCGGVIDGGYCLECGREFFEEEGMVE